MLEAAQWRGEVDFGLRLRSLKGESQMMNENELEAALFSTTDLEGRIDEETDAVLAAVADELRPILRRLEQLEKQVIELRARGYE